MSFKKFMGAASAALTIVIVLILALAPAAGAAGKYKVLHAFHGSDGEYPGAGLIFDAEGNLYGTASEGGNGSQCGGYGCGVVFKLTSNTDGSWTESVLHLFTFSDGAYPQASLIFDAVGNLYGTTMAGGGGTYSAGAVFKLAPNGDGSWTESVLHSFNVVDGAYPEAGLIFDAAGNLYGTASEGGNGSPCGGYGCGVVFKLTSNTDGSWTESVLHLFTFSDGAYPAAGLIFDAAGNLYGTTAAGGIGTGCHGYGCGTVFELTPNADGRWTESVLHVFEDNGDGASPGAGVIFDAAGYLYGTTSGTYCNLHGHGHGCGTVFKLTPNADGSWTESTLYRFKGDRAAYPIGGLIFDGAGNLYGTASSGGPPAYSGAAFKLSPSQDGSWAYSLLHVFQDKPASTPSAGLVLGSAGTLYGTTANNRTNSHSLGVVYQITP